MDVILWAVLIIIGIGVLAIGIPLLGLALLLWFIVLPVIGACLGGWMGFFFGVGLDVVIYIVYRCLKSFNENIKERSERKKGKEIAIPKQINIKPPKDVITGIKK
jgi:hypothetical protein